MRTLENLFSLKGKVALVTGGAGYLGRAICDSLAELGATVIIASRNLENCKDFAFELNQKYNANCWGSFCDVTDISSLTDLFNRIEAEHEGLDILVNDAWSGNKNTLESISIEDWNYDINVCLNGPFYTVKIMLPLLKKNHGIILNIASMYGIVSPDYKMYYGTDHANPPSYGAAKAGIIQLTKYLASFLAPDKIRVNAISPGPFPFKSSIDKMPDFVKILESKNMMGRVGNPEDLKGVVALLCSDASAYITGQNISIDGGWTSW
jgi:NAD(P)-dependent dehydrogenase (short-subunit alcohol dehydrogenase family)